MSTSHEPDNRERMIAARLALLPTRSTPPSVRTFLLRAQRGDADAFGNLYDATVDLVFRYLYYGTGNERLTQTLTSATYLTAHGRILEPNSARTDPVIWLLGLAREILQAQLGESFRLRITSRNIQGDADSAEMLEAIALLTPDQQECLTLRALLQLNDADIATLTHRTLGETRILLVWSHATLAENLDQREE